MFFQFSCNINELIRVVSRISEYPLHIIYRRLMGQYLEKNVALYHFIRYLDIFIIVNNYSNNNVLNKHFAFLDPVLKTNISFYNKNLKILKTLTKVKNTTVLNKTFTVMSSSVIMFYCTVPKIILISA